MKNKFIKTSGYVCFLAVFALTFASFIILLSSQNGAASLPIILFSLPFLTTMFAGVFFVTKDRLLSFMYSAFSSLAFLNIYMFLAPKFYDPYFRSLGVAGLFVSIILVLYTFLTPFANNCMCVKKAYKIFALLLLFILGLAVIIFFVVFSKVILITPLSPLPI